MRILIATHHLLSFTGSELYTLWLAKSVKQSGHDVYVYSPFLDKLFPFFEQAGIPVVSHLEAYAGMTFDVAHVHHNIIAQEVRFLFPHLPIVMQIHGTKPLLEQLPQENIYPSALLCVCESVRESLITKGVHPDFLDIARNGIDLEWWRSDRVPALRPAKALIISARMPDDKLQVIETACTALNITLTKVGGRFGMATPEKVRSLLEETDFVITIGRGVMEATAAGRPVLVFDQPGGDGFLTPWNFRLLMQTNFNGRITATHYTSDELQEVIRTGYNPSDVSQNQQLLKQYFAQERVVQQLLEIYHTAATQQIPSLPYQTLARIQRHVGLVQETRQYGQLQYDTNVEEFKAGKTYRLWIWLHRQIDSLRFLNRILTRKFL